MQITLAEIIKRLREVLARIGHPDVQGHDAIRTLFGSEDALLAFTNRLNEAPGFRVDGIQLTPSDVRSAKVVADLVVVIANQYKRKNWTVIGKDDEPF